jgi:hypothetical protein
MSAGEAKSVNWHNAQRRYIVAIDQAALDVIGRTRLIEENLPTSHQW